MTFGFPDWREPVAAEAAASDFVRQRRRNRRHAGLLLLAMFALLGLCGWLVAGWDGILWSILAGILVLLTMRRMPTDVFLQAMGARPLWPGEASGLETAFAALCRRSGLSPVPALYLIDEELPLAFSLGEGDNAAVVVAECLLAGLTRREVCAILAHEITHLRSGDVFLKEVGFVLGWLTRVLSQLGLMLVVLGLLLHVLASTWLPMLSLLALAAAPIAVNLLQLALSRTREAEADLEAAALTGDPAALVSALLKLRQWQELRLRQLFPTGRILHLPTLFNDHPPTQERIRRLQQMR